MTAKTVSLASILCIVVPVMFGASQAHKRLHSNIDDSETFILKGNIRPAVSTGVAQDMGSVPLSQPLPRLSVHFKLTPAQQAELEQLLKDQQNRRSPQFHKFLTPEEYADRFGLNTADIAKITRWLENNGFSNIQSARGRTSIAFSGSVAQLQAAFHTSIHSYTLKGQSHISNATDMELPRALDGVVESVSGLHDFRAKPHFTSSSGTNYLVPDDWATIYHVKPLYSAGLDGSPLNGQTYSIAVVGQSDVQASDIAAFRAAAGLGPKTITTIIPQGDSDPGLQSATDQAESDLDLEWAGAIAPNANILFVTAGGVGVENAIEYAVDHMVAPVLSISYGWCEQDLASGEFSTLEGIFQQAASQGMTIVAASGDNGAAACDTGTVATHGLAVDYPASSQYVTGIGGTEFTPPATGTYFSSSNNANGNGGSALSYIPEIAWNDGNLAATGGGVSTLTTKPSWQTGPGVPSDGQRDVPDLALAASIKNVGLLFCSNGSCTSGFLNSSSAPSVTGGTSAATSAFAGVVALLVQSTGSLQGPFNPNLYSLASISGNAFHDILSGNNIVNCQGGTTACPTSVSTATGNYGYTAGPGYDQTTGLGSIDAYNLVEQWAADIQLTATPSGVNLTPGATNNSANVTVTATSKKNFTGPVTFSCSVAANIAGIISCSVPNTPVQIAANGQGTATVTITATPPSSGFLPRHRLPQFPKMPPFNSGWLAATLAALLTGFVFRKYRFTPRTMATLAAAGFLALTVGAVSCGSSASTALSMTCNLTEAQVAVAYSATCAANSGKTPYTYSIVSGDGNLPAGLNLNTSTGTISGTPTATGVDTFTVQVTDSATKTFTVATAITVRPAPIENGLVTVTATSGSIVNTTTILVTTAL